MTEMAVDSLSLFVSFPVYCLFVKLSTFFLFLRPLLCCVEGLVEDCVMPFSSGASQGELVSK